MDPYPEGTLAVGRTPDGIPVRRSCESHLFELGRASVRHWLDEDHIMQSARCIVCDETIAPIDVEFFYEEANAFDRERCLDAIDAQIERLQRARERVSPTAPALRNFD